MAACQDPQVLERAPTVELGVLGTAAVAGALSSERMRHALSDTRRAPVVGGGELGDALSDAALGGPLGGPLDPLANAFATLQEVVGAIMNSNGLG